MNFFKPLFRASTLFLILLSNLIAPNLHAQTSATILVPVALAPVQRDTPVELTALTLDAEIEESNGRTIISGNSTFKLHNTDRANDLQIAVGFPTWAGDVYTFDPARFGVFNVSIDGTRVRTLNPARADLKIGNTIRAVDWYTFTVSIAADEKSTVRYDFVQDLGDSVMPRMIYGMLPAVNWKGAIGSARLTLSFPNNTTLEQIIAYDPPNPEFDGKSITWRFTTKEPPTNPALTFLRQSVWDDLNAKRRTAQQNPNDANARAALGNLLRQLAAIDSPKHDSLAMQAIAELETAVRLDPNNRTARQALGAVYETRAGAATGPRNVGYVQLAIAQWEALQNDATARRQLAEDYFYLGLDAQTRRDFSNASNYYDKASALAPGGAGPLFTLERMNAQRKSLNIAWARALLEQTDLANASSKARAALGDKFMTQFSPPAFYVTRAQVTTSAQTRALTFTLAPYLSPGEMQNAASGAVAVLRKAVDVDANLTAEGLNAVVSIAIPFENRAQLAAKLEALAKALPNRVEWSLVRAVLSSNDFAWSERDEIFARTTSYREQVNLAAACDAFTAQSDEIARNLSALQNISASDEEGQLKRAMLQAAQRGWQNALAFGRVTYRAGNEESRVDICNGQTLAWSSSSWKVERIGLAFLIIQAIIIPAVVWWWIKKRPRESN